MSKQISNTKKYLSSLNNVVPNAMSVLRSPRQTTATLILAATGVFVFLPPNFNTKALFLFALAAIVALHRYRIKKKACPPEKTPGHAVHRRARPSEKQLAQIRHRLITQGAWEKKAELPILDQ
jgi:hypothetical protein